MKKLVVKDNRDESRTISCKNPGNDMLSGLRNLRKEKSLCDVIIKVDDGEVWAHKNVLAVNSPYFHAMFIQGFSEAQAREIELRAEGLDLFCVQTLVDFMYTGQLSVSKSSVQGLIIVADLWQMAEVKGMCEDYMERQIDEENCLGIKGFAEVYQCQKLVERSLHLVKQRFPVVSLASEFLHLSLAELQDILSFHDLCLGQEGEDDVVKALFRWLDGHQHDLSMDSLSSLIRTVHWSATTFACRNQFLQHPVISENEELQRLVQTLAEDRTEGRQGLITLYVIGGFLQSRTGPKCPRLCGVERLDEVTSRWWPCADFPMLSSSTVAFNLYSHLFCCACEPISLPNSNVTVTRTDIFEYNMMRNEWSSAEDQFSGESVNCIDTCLQAEGALAVCPQTFSIYAVSHSEVASLNVNLVNGDILCRSWQLLPRPHAYFTEQQRHFSAVVLDRCLYVLGGDRHDMGHDPVPTACVIMYDIRQRQWHRRADMLEPRVKLAAAVLKGKIYANGGFTVRRLATMECYDPATDQWTALTAMHRFRSHHQLLVRHNTLWAIGGKSYAVENGGPRKVLNVCEVYDADSNTWTEDSNLTMKNARCGFAAIAI